MVQPPGVVTVRVVVPMEPGGVKQVIAVGLMVLMVAGLPAMVTVVPAENLRVAR